jgi:methylglutaconyl-CoA hydratase
MAEFVQTSDSGGVRTITIDRPDVHNAFNEVVIEELGAAMVAAGADASVRVVVLASAGPSFSAGADIHWMKRMVDYSREENLADSRAMAGMLRAIRECRRPVIARVQGACYGGGVGLVAACDLSVAVASAQFALTEVKLGILPAVISPYVVERIGPGHMRRFALTAERFDAAEARRIGLVSEVVDDEAGLDEKIAFFAKLLKKNGPEALTHCKALLRDIQAADWDVLTMTTTERIAERRVSAEGQDGLKAFLEKRPAAWIAAAGDDA